MHTDKYDNGQPQGGMQEADVSFMDTREAGLIIGFDPRTVRRMCASGEIPARLIGSEYRISRKEFREWLDKTRVQPKAPPTAEPA